MPCYSLCTPAAERRKNNPITGVVVFARLIGYTCSYRNNLSLTQGDRNCEVNIKRRSPAFATACPGKLFLKAVTRCAFIAA